MNIAVPASGKKAKFLLTMIMASLMANECQPQDVHKKLSESRDFIRDKSEQLDGELSKIFEITAFMIDWMIEKGADAYNFFFHPDEFSIKTLLANGQIGSNEIMDDLNKGLLTSGEVVNFYRTVKIVIENLNMEYTAKQENLYFMLLVALDGFAEIAENS